MEKHMATKCDGCSHQPSPPAKEIALGDAFGTAVVQGGGIKVELNSANDGVVVYTNGPVTVVRPAY
jgi:hypothetical protein